MSSVLVHQILTDKILVSRESAHCLRDALSSSLMSCRSGAGSTGDPALVTVDFAGIEGMTPSFLDELISIFEGLLAHANEGCRAVLLVAHPPTRLSLKFEAVARGHEMVVEALPDGSWRLSQPR